MAAIAKSQVSLFPTGLLESEWATGGPVDKKHIVRRLKVTGVDSGDTATADVLGVSELLGVTNAFSADGPVDVAVNPVTNLIVATELDTAALDGSDLYLTILGVPKLTI